MEPFDVSGDGADDIVVEELLEVAADRNRLDVAGTRNSDSISLASGGASVLEAAPMRMLCCFNCIYHATVSNSFSHLRIPNKVCTYSSQNVGYVLIELKAFTISILYLGAILHSFERRRDVRVNPKRPKCVVHVEHDDFGKWGPIGEYC